MVGQKGDIIFNLSDYFGEIMEVDKLKNDYVSVYYTNSNDHEVSSVVSAKGYVVFKEALEFQILSNGSFKVYQKGYMIDDSPIQLSETTKYYSILDYSGNLIVGPSVKDIEYNSRKRHYFIADDCIFNLDGKLITSGQNKRK